MQFTEKISVSIPKKNKKQNHMLRENMQVLVNETIIIFKHNLQFVHIFYFHLKKICFSFCTIHIFHQPTNY